MYINYEKLRQALAKTMAETRASEDSLFALCYDVFSGGASTFSSRNPWKRSSCASRQLLPRTYYFNYDKNLVDELFKSQDSQSFSRYSYDATRDTNFDEIDYYNSYLHMQRLFENIDRIFGIDQEDMYNSSYEEHLMPREEKRLHFDDNEAKHKEFNDDIIKGGGDSEGSRAVWYTQHSSYYSTSTNYMYWDSNEENEDILLRNNMLDVERSKSAEGL